MELSFHGLTVTLDKRRVLDGIEAVLKAGRITAILGPNGAGKSTLVSCAAGLRRPDAGEARLGDKPVTAYDHRARGRLIGFLPQDATVHWNIAARDLVALGRLPHRGPFAGLSEADRAAIARAMAATDTSAFTDRLMREMSGGERARVLLARVLAGEPRWLLADEPLASLDPAHQIDVLDRLREAAREGMGVVLVLHDLGHAARIADDVLLLKGGRIAAWGPAREVLAPDRLRAVYQVEVHSGIAADGSPLLVPLGRSVA